MNLEILSPSGAGESDILGIGKAGGFGETIFERYYDGSTFDRGLRIKEYNEDIIDIVGNTKEVKILGDLVAKEKVVLEDVLNLQALSVEPQGAVAGDVYLDDGTNTASGNHKLRYFNGTTWIDL